MGVNDENLTMAPRISDITYITKSLLFMDDKILDKKAFSLFLKEYEKTNPLTKAEKRTILPWLVRYNCVMFDEFYEPVQLGKCSEESCLIWTINTAKGLAKALGWKK